MLGKAAIRFLAADLPQPQQCKFDLFMAGGEFWTGVQEAAHQQIGRLAGDFEHALLACGQIMRNPGFDQMAVAIQFVFDL
ncbi:hypothetical protein SDC9_107283 [bioreactor metagenome]|uniref:Uncharacterized protein n=1 Tax=bioreactor metagenome TaxID=1076179 RepID=A0A645B4T3_9ZZZZ